MNDELRLELVNTWPDSAGNLDIFATLSGRRIPLWFGDEPREVLVTRVASDGGSPERITVLAHYTSPAPPSAPSRDGGQTFLGWRVESITEQ